LGAEQLYIVIALLLALLAAYGLAFWAAKARTDRSALVGLYLLFGIPGSLLAIYGLARIVNGEQAGLVWLLTGLGLTLPLLRPSRNLVARLIPIDPASPIDMSGLAAVLAVIGFLATSYALDPEPVGTGEVALADLISQFLAMMVLSYILVGTGIWRNLREATIRLGLVRPSTRDVALSLGAVVAGLIVMGIAAGLTALFQPDVSEQIQRATENITANVQNPLGALLFGLGAGASEELLLRGALQPRFGIGITAFVFALLHSQYGISFILLGVFGMGIILGLQRKYLNTTSAIITHAVFNALAVMAGS
jgi:uncharacterized protein